MIDSKTFASRYLTDLSKAIAGFDKDQFDKLVQLFFYAYDEGRRIFVMGNGGSGATASHLACDINKGCCLDRDKKFKVICLNDNLPSLLAYANDLSYASIFVEQMKNFFIKGDVVIGISASGNSENVLKAVSFANENGGKTAGLCGFSGGKLARMVHVPLVVRMEDMQKVEDLHFITAHMIMQVLYAWLHPKEHALT